MLHQHAAGATAALLLSLTASQSPALAQGSAYQTGGRPPAPKAQTKRAPQPTPAAPSDAGLRQRVEQLEEQLVDLQVHLGTVESMSRGGAPAAAAAYRGGGSGTSGADAGRIAALETQVQALTAQLESMAAQLRSLQSGGSAAPPRGPSGPAPRVGSFGPPTVVPADDPIANIINQPGNRAEGPYRTASPSGGMGARQQYDQAYTLLLQQNYPAAEAGFAEFLQQHPRDELSPNAQFWLGETYFVRGQWDSAAAAFLRVAQQFPRAEKAPDSLAKLAMSMERKGNKTAACRALQELKTRYPSPPAHVRTWEQAERRRAGCS